MTKATSTSAQPVPKSSGDWVSCAVAAAALGVTEKTVWRRAKSGRLTGRKVSSERGGLVWEIAVDATGQPTDQATAQPTGQRAGRNAAAAAIDAQTDRTRPTAQPDESNRPTDQTTGHTPDFAARYVEHLERENEFLRRALEGAQQSEAMTKAALREALKAMPKQLTSGEQNGAASEKLEQVGTAQQTAPRAPISGQIGTDDQREPTARNDAPDGDISTYGALADWLENQV